MGGRDSGGVVVQTDEGGGTRALVFGWVAVILGIGVTVSSVILSAQLGIALLFVGGGLGVALMAVGVGEGVRRARYGDAARIEAKARMIEARRGAGRLLDE